MPPVERSDYPAPTRLRDREPNLRLNPIQLILDLMPVALEDRVFDLDEFLPDLVDIRIVADRLEERWEIIHGGRFRYQPYPISTLATRGFGSPWEKFHESWTVVSADTIPTDNQGV